MRSVAKTLAVSWGFLALAFVMGALATRQLAMADSVARCFGMSAVGFAVLAFFCEYIDSTLGMGYGTALTPLLMVLFGLEPLVVVPCVLASELVTGVSAGIAHHSVGNVSFTRRSKATKVAAILSACSVVGAVAAALVALSVPKVYLKVAIGLIVLSMGVFILVSWKRKVRFSWAKVTGLGLVAAFNKGLSGGGYGPLVTGGQIVSGVEEKSAIGITSLSEGVTCAVGLAVYLIAGKAMAWSLAVPLMLGALASVPVSAVTVSRVPTRALRTLVGLATLGLGALTLTQLL
jgi:uncharacterized membrane protein YfcA